MADLYDSNSNVDPFDIQVGGYGATLEKIAPGINQAISDSSSGESWFDTLKKVIPALTMTAQQYQLMNLNIERAKQGLPPIDIASYSGVGVNVGIAPDTQKLLLWGGAALLLVLFLRNKRG